VLGCFFGVGLGSLVNVFNFEIVIFGGVLWWVFFFVKEDVFEGL